MPDDTYLISTVMKSRVYLGSKISHEAIKRRLALNCKLLSPISETTPRTPRVLFLPRPTRRRRHLINLFIPARCS